MTPLEKTRETRTLFACWIALLALTVLSFSFAEGDITLGRSPDGRLDSQAATAALVLGVAALKAHLIAGRFMELSRAPRAAAISMSVFILTLTGLLIALFSQKAGG